MSERERNWDADQKKKNNDRLQEKINKAKRGQDYVMRLLKDCKTWRGPATTGEELRESLSGRDDQQHILRTEMAYYAHTHKQDRIANKDLYRINGISFEDMLENLTILLDDDGCCPTASTANLPTNSDVVSLLKTPMDQVATSETSEAKVNDMRVVVWQEDNGYEWYLGYIKDIENGKYSVDHLARVLKNSDSNWKYPSHDDIQLADSDQIVKCTVDGEWDMLANARKRIFTVKNITTIIYAFENHIA